MRLYADAPMLHRARQVGPTTSNRASKFWVGFLGQRTLLEGYVRSQLGVVKSF